MAGVRRGGNAAQVADPAASVLKGVAVEHFPPKTSEGNAYRVMKAGNHREVADGEDGCVVRPSPADEADDAL